MRVLALVGVVALAGCDREREAPRPAPSRPAPSVVASTAPRDAAADVSLRPGPCPDGMVLISGAYCPYVGHRCVDWIDEKRDRCRRYAPPALCEGRIRNERFCIDRYEYPNEAGALPVVMVSFIEARDACQTEGKRLCTEDEWTFACEGEERLPYPYGYERDATACNIDRPHILPDFEAFSDD